MTNSPYGRVYTAFELIRDYGDRTNDKCSCCGGFTLYAIRYPDNRGTVLLCSLCDVERTRQT